MGIGGWGVRSYLPGVGEVGGSCRTYLPVAVWFVCVVVDARVVGVGLPCGFLCCSSYFGGSVWSRVVGG